VAVSIAGQGVKVVANSGVHFHRGTPIYDSPVLIRTDELGDKVAESLGDLNAVLLRGHGGTVVAGDLDRLLRLGIDCAHCADSNHGLFAGAGENAHARGMRADVQK
jgi:hypothetical protein